VRKSIKQSKEIVDTSVKKIKNAIGGISDETGRNKIRKTENRKRTTPGIPKWSPTVVLTRPDVA
jgi:hypothetical protein